MRGEGDPSARWFGELAASLERLEVYGMAIVVIDVSDGRILGATTAAAELFGGPLPSTMADLLDEGAISRPDLSRLDRKMRATRVAGSETGGESSAPWSDQLRIHRRGQDSQDLRLEVIVHHRAALDASAAIVTVWPADHDGQNTDRAEGDLDDIWVIYDSALRMVAADPVFADLGIDPLSQLGAMAWMYAYPDDIPEPQRLVDQVLAGRLRTAQYSCRLRARSGNWVDTNIEARRLVTADGPCLLVVARYVNPTRRSIPMGALTASQLRAVDGLFDGLRVAQISERDGLAVKTVRNHLAAAYARLDVAGQLELLSTYHRPGRPSDGS